MRVLWLSSATISVNADENTGIEGKGWIGSLLQLALQIDGLEIVVAYENHSPEHKETVQKGRVTVAPLNISRYSKRQILKDLVTQREVDEVVVQETLKLIDQYKPDLIHVFGSEWGFGLIAPHTNVPVVIHIQGLWSQIRNCLLLPGQSEFSDRVKFSLLRHPLWFYARYHYYDLYLERAQREEEILRCNRYFMCRTRWDKSIVRMYSPDAQVFHVDEALRSEFTSSKQQWCPRKDGKQIVLATVGACYPIKGPDVVLKAARLIRENTGLEVVWKWIGGSVQEILEYEKLTGIKAADVGLRMMGTMDAARMVEELLASDIYVHPSYADNSPNAVCEAQTLGMPVIATNAGGTPSLFDSDYDPDLLVPVNDPFYLSAKIVELYRDQDKMLRLGQSNMKVALRRHDEQHILSQLADAYKQIINNASV